MPRGVPCRVQVAGKGTRTYTYTEIARGTGLSLSLVSLIMRGKRPLSEYAQPRFAEFFGIPVEQLGAPGTFTTLGAPVRKLGRIIDRIPRNSIGSLRSGRIIGRVDDPYSAYVMVGPFVTKIRDVQE